MRKLLIGAAFALVLGGASGAQAAGESVPPPNHAWSFEGMFGTYDRAALRRGFQVYQTVCAACHGLRLVAYRNLTEIGFPADEVREIAAALEVTDGPDDQGESFVRPGRASDRFVSPFPNPQAARAANNGALPPDLSLMTKARKNGSDYVRAMLIGYQDPPAGVPLMDGMYYNIYFPGHQIAMPPVLTAGAVAYPEGVEATPEQMAHDVATFLTWAAEPEMEERKRLGIKVMLFLIVLTGMLYAVKRHVWSKIH
jgi:ubiquinol-cytochrome c reductase cytochrome c1 subunit